jgi:hypothetical protein
VKRLLAIQEALLCLVRKWWRPVSAVFIALTMGVNGVFLPLARWWRTSEFDTDLMGLAALVTATAGAFAVREWGKVKGTVE